jgi:hypothetical protein
MPSLLPITAARMPAPAAHRQRAPPKQGRGASPANRAANRLRLSEAKSRVCHLDEGFVFLGFHIQRRRKRGTGKMAVYTYPSKKALASIMAKVRALTHGARHRTVSLTPEN